MKTPPLTDEQIIALLRGESGVMPNEPMSLDVAMTAARLAYGQGYTDGLVERDEAQR